MFRITEQCYESGRRMPPHEHDYPSFSLVLRGTFCERMGKTAETIQPLSISLMPAGVAHADQFGSAGATLLTVHFEGRGVEDFEMAAGALERWRWVHGGPGVRLFLRLLRAFRKGEDQATTQLVLDALVATNTAAAIRGLGEPPRWLELVKTAIHDSPTRPSADGLAAIGKVHRVYLARQFRRFYGCSISTYVRRQRVQRAARLISQFPRGISTVAQESGFSDHPHLCRVFLQETGLTPSEFRAAAVDD